MRLKVLRDVRDYRRGWHFRGGTTVVVEASVGEVLLREYPGSFERLEEEKPKRKRENTQAKKVVKK